MGEQMRKVM